MKIVTYEAYIEGEKNEVFKLSRLRFKIECLSLVWTVLVLVPTWTSISQFSYRDVRMACDKVAIEGLESSSIIIQIERSTIAIVIRTFCKSSYSASLELDAIEHFWNLNFAVFILSFEYPSNMLMIETFCLAYWSLKIVSFKCHMIDVAKELLCCSPWTKFLNLILRPTSTLNSDLQHKFSHWIC